MTNGIELLIDDCHGVFIPKSFVDDFTVERWGLDRDSWKVQTCADPEADGYWDAWWMILNTAEIELNGNVWRLYQDGALYAVCPELMSDEEKTIWGWEV